MRLLLVGNCQVVGLRDCISSALPDFDVEAVEVWNKTAEQLNDLARQVESCEVLLMHPLFGPQYAVLNEARGARSASRRSLTIHSFYWTGTAPDSRYVGGLGRRVSSPVMNHHSGRVLEAFLAGKNEAEAVASFGAWSRAEVIEAWNASRSAFVLRERVVDVKFMEELDASLATMHCFHVFNHPTVELLHAYSAKIVETVALGTKLDVALPPDRLARMGSFPVYDAVREHMELPYRHPNFTVGSNADPLVMGVSEFVEKSYATYRAQPRELLK